MRAATIAFVALSASRSGATSASGVIGEPLPSDAKGPAVTGYVSAKVSVYPVRCTDAPEEEIVECPRADNAKASMVLGPKTKVIFNNTNYEDVSLYWLNYEGQEHYVDVIKPQGRNSQDTTMGHMFRLRSLTGRILLDHVVGLRPIYNDAEIQDPPADPDTNETRPTYEKESSGFVKGYINRAGFHLNIKWLNPRTNHYQLATQMKSEEFNYEHTYSMHEFHAFTADDRFVTKFVVDDVAVPFCPDVTPVAGAFDMSGEKTDVVDKTSVCGTNSTICGALEEKLFTIALEPSLKLGALSNSFSM